MNLIIYKQFYIYLILLFFTCKNLNFHHPSFLTHHLIILNHLMLVTEALKSIDFRDTLPLHHTGLQTADFSIVFV